MNDWLSAAADLFKAKDYIISKNEKLTFININDRANSLAQFLQIYYNLKRGDITVIISDNNIDFIILLFALWKSGAIAVPINIRLNETEKNNLITFLKPSLIFIDRIENKNISPIDTKIIQMPDDYVSPDKVEIKDSFNNNHNDFDENNTALILFTSGTSGNPKGVKLSFHNLRASYNNCNSVLNHDKNDKWIASLPFYHIGGFSIITRTLLSGISLIIPASLSTDDLGEEINYSKPTFLSLVSTQLKRLIDLGIKPNIELKYVLLGGGYIENSLVDEAIKLRWPIAKVYGSTETSSLVTFVDCTNDKKNKLSGGKSLTENKIFIVDEKKGILPPNKVGEIAIKSESCAKEYYNNHVETRNKFRKGIYYTGDSGFIDEEGYLYIDSRMDNLIISGGENINPFEIETALMEYTGVQNAFAFGQDDDEWGKIVSAAVMIKPGLNISENELKEFLLKKISSFKLPRRIYFLNEFPIGPLGKIQKDMLIELIKS